MAVAKLLLRLVELFWRWHRTAVVCTVVEFTVSASSHRSEEVCVTTVRTVRVRVARRGRVQGVGLRASGSQSRTELVLVRAQHSLLVAVGIRSVQVRRRVGRCVQHRHFGSVHWTLARTVLQALMHLLVARRPGRLGVVVQVAQLGIVVVAAARIV